MSAYNDRNAGCIDGASLVLLESGSERRVCDLQRGDRVVGLGGVAEVLCAVRVHCETRRAWLVELPGGARLTPYHPVLVLDEWRFPCELGDVHECQCEAVYSFVLSGAPALLVNNVACIALAHGLQDGAAKHEYLGTCRVLGDLGRCLGYQDGAVNLFPQSFIRDARTGMICGIQT